MGARSSALKPETSNQVFHRETIIPVPRGEVFAFFSDPRNLARITPPSLGFEIVQAPDRPLRADDRIDYSVRIMGIRFSWRTHITVWEPGARFIDEQERGPYAFWSHEHSLSDSVAGTLMVDHVEYRLPLGTLGRLAAGWWVRRNLRAIFDYRGTVINEIFHA